MGRAVGDSRSTASNSVNLGCLDGQGCQVFGSGSIATREVQVSSWGVGGGNSGQHAESSNSRLHFDGGVCKRVYVMVVPG